MSRVLSGILVVGKPEGPTSFAAVKRIRSLCGGKVGHAGTLDPFASGVLVICLGKATRLAGYLTDHSKEYRATGRLGLVTDTLDITGAVVSKQDPTTVRRDEIEAVLDGFRGPIQQVPPLYSAKRVDGKRMYEIARAGGEVDRCPVAVTIERLELIDVQGDRFSLSVRASKGTYIRSLVHDIGQALGCGALTEELVRTASGPFSLENAVSLEDLEARQDVADRLMSMTQALPHWSLVILDDGALEEIGHGRSVQLSPEILQGLANPAQVRLVDEEGVLAALGSIEGERVRPFRVFL